MNRIYRLVWNHVTNAWVCCAETARGRGKSSSGRKSRTVGAVAMAGGALISSMALAAPTGGQISAGSGQITQSGTKTTINQGSQNLAVNWQSFGIASNESVNFVQPNSSAIALNRVTGQSNSQILGSLSANGQVFIINPNGVLFGTGAQVNVGGLVATTLSLSDADFMAGKTSFSGTGGSVVNQGNLTAAKGGYIALLAPQVSNQGVISATLGKALLAAGNKVTLTLNNGSLLGYSIDQGALNALAENKQLIQADGGQVYLTAKAADALSMAVVNNTGVIEARTIQNVNGTIKLLGDMQAGTVNVGGTLDASAPTSGNGGQIETSAAHVHVASDAKITTAAANGLSGTWLIDPVDFTIAASGGDITGTTLTSELAAGNVTILSTSGASGTSGNINVNDTVSWGGTHNNLLTLNAQNNININSTMNVTGTASLALIFGQSAVALNNTSTISTGTIGVVNLPAGTTNFTTKQGSDGTTKNYTVITTLGVATDATGGAATLQGMAATANLAKNYVLGTNIAASGTSTWNSNAGFTPIGNSTTNYSGTFDGLGHTISGLTINQTGTAYIGLFGCGSATSVIRNVGMVGGSVSGGRVSGGNYVGGLVGYGKGTISNSYATGNVSGYGYVGGLAGYNVGTISNSYATGSANGTNYVGGLVGSNYGKLSNSYATGNVSGSNNYVGGLVGYGKNETISNSYATGNASNAATVGGLVGYAYGGTISNSYATGRVTGTSPIGGLVGQNNGTTLNADFWDVTKSGTTTGVGSGTATGATGLTTAQMQTQSSFTPAGTGTGQWNFTAGSGTWVIFAGQSNPLLRALMTPLTVTANNDTKTYDGLAYNGSAGVTYSVTPNTSNLTGSLSYTGGTNAGSYTITPSGLSSYVQQGYLITYANGTLTVNKAPLTVTGISASNKVYDGTTAATLTGTAIVSALGSDVVTVGGTGTGVFADANVGTGKTVTVSGYTLSGAAAGNYTIVEPSGLTANITAAAAATTSTSTSTSTSSTTSTNSSSSSGVVSPELITAIDNLLNGTGLVVAFSDAKNVVAAPIVVPEIIAMNTPITLPTPAGAPSPTVPAAGSSGNGNEVVVSNNAAPAPSSSSAQSKQASVNVAMDNVVVQLGSGVTIVNGGIRLPDDMRTSQRSESSIKGRGN